MNGSRSPRASEWLGGRRVPPQVGGSSTYTRLWHKKFAANFSWVRDTEVRESGVLFSRPFSLRIWYARNGRPYLSLSLSDFEQRRQEITKQIAQLGDLRAGSVTNTSGRCGKPDCRCHRPGQPGHGPNLRPTYK